MRSVAVGSTAARHTATTAAALTIGGVGVLAGQTLFARRRRDLPRLPDLSPAGSEGDPGDPPVRIAVFGDSTTTGPGLADPGQIWVRLVARRLAQGRRVDVEHHGRSGLRMAGAFEAIGQLTRPVPDICWVVCGVNDAAWLTPLDRFEVDLHRLLSRAAAAGLETVVTGVGDPGVSPRIPRPLSRALDARARAVDERIRRVLGSWPATHHLDMRPAMRILGEHPEWFTADLFHPDARGHELLAQHAWPVVARAVAAVESRRGPTLTMSALSGAPVGTDPGLAGDIGLGVS